MLGDESPHRQIGGVSSGRERAHAQQQAQGQSQSQQFLHSGVPPLILNEHSMLIQFRTKDVISGQH
jgi:hypothetical protein